MTENKRFTTVELPKPNRWGIWYDGAYLSTYQICTLLNEFVDVKNENEQLKKENNHLKYKLGDREEAFEVLISEIHDKITALIDKKIKELSYKDKVCIIPRESITVLNELKMELKL